MLMYPILILSILLIPANASGLEDKSRGDHKSGHSLSLVPADSEVKDTNSDITITLPSVGDLKKRIAPHASMYVMNSGDVYFSQIAGKKLDVNSLVETALELNDRILGNAFREWGAHIYSILENPSTFKLYVKEALVENILSALVVNAETQLPIVLKHWRTKFQPKFDERMKGVLLDMMLKDQQFTFRVMAAVDADPKLVAAHRKSAILIAIEGGLRFK